SFLVERRWMPGDFPSVSGIVSFSLYKFGLRMKFRPMANGKMKINDQAGVLGFEAQLWAAADKMRGHMDASEYKHVSLGLIFLKYIPGAFEEKREQLLFGFSNPKSEWFMKAEPQRQGGGEFYTPQCIVQML